MDKKIRLTIIIVVVIFASFLIFKNIGYGTTGYVINEQNVENLHETSLAIEGMYCDACAYGVKAQIEELEGVVKADINAWEASGVVIYDADKVDPNTIAAASTVYLASVVSDRSLA